MSVLFRVDPVAGVVFTTFMGVVTVDDFAAYARVLATDPDFQPTFGELLDATAVQSVAAGSDFLRDAARGSVFAPGARRAVIAPTDLTYGIARMMQQVYGGPATIEVFRDRAEARAWLGLGG
jgi:hypothetical protein